MKKILHKIKEQIELLSLDLTDKIVLTEAATGAYIVTPIVAALAGANVYAYAKDSRYGTVENVFKENRKLLNDLDLNLKINFIEEIDSKIVAEADIITNSGHLRPLDLEKLKFVKDGCVIPLMYEAWELRADDLDIEFCRKKRISIGATNERHPDINVFSYLGDMAVKQLFDSGVCLHGNNFVLICNNEFGTYIANVLINLCSGLGVVDNESRKNLYDERIDWLGNFPEFTIPNKYKVSDAIIFTGYPFDKTWIGDEGTEIPIKKIIEEFSNPYIIRFAGDIDTSEFDDKRIAYFPKKVSSGHMGVLPSDIGFDPIIKLQSGGLKAGELMLQGKTEYNGIQLVELL